MIKRLYSAMFCFIYICGILLFTDRPVYASVNYIEFRLVLDKQDLDSKEYDTVISGNEALRISKFYFLSDIDIKEVIMLRSFTTRNKIIAGFRFTENGKKKLGDIIIKYPDHKIAIFAHNALLVTLPARLADCIAIIWPRGEKNLCWIAKKINKKPDGIIDLYMDETAKYNDVAAKEWANLYSNVGRMLSNKKNEDSPSDNFPPED